MVLGKPDDEQSHKEGYGRRLERDLEEERTKELIDSIFNDEDEDENEPSENFNAYRNKDFAHTKHHQSLKVNIHKLTLDGRQPDTVPVKQNNGHFLQGDQVRKFRIALKCRI